MSKLFFYKRLALGVAVATIGLFTVPNDANADEAKAARAAAKKPNDTGCTLLPIDPYTEPSGDNIVATSSTSCRGPVKNVRTTVRLYKFQLWWVVYEERTQPWGNVPSTKNGSLQTWKPNVPGSACTEYMTQAVVSWNASTRTPFKKVLYSKSRFLNSAGPCTLPSQSGKKPSKT